MGMNPPRDPWGKDCTFGVGQLIDWEAVVCAHCVDCGGTWPVDLHKVMAAYGRWFRLIPRRPPCRTRGCPSKLRFFITGMRPLDRPADPPEPVSKLSEYQKRRALEQRRRV